MNLLLRCPLSHPTGRPLWRVLHARRPDAGARDWRHYHVLFNPERPHLRPLPYSDPDRLVAVRVLVDTGTLALSYESVARLPASPFGAVVAYTTSDVNATAPDGAQRVVGTRVSGDIFALLGAPFSVGRPLLPADLGATTPTEVISYSFWTRHYAAEPSVAGRTIGLDHVAHEIVGVAPDGFGFPADTDIWVPLQFEPGRQPGPIDVVGRLADGVTIQRAAAMLAGVSAVDPAHNPPGARRGPDVIRLHDSMVAPKHRPMLTALLTATILVLLVACANLAGLLAAHLDSRRHELALRVALGAKRTRIIRLLLIESVALAAVGGAFGILIARWGIELFAATLGKPQGAGWLNFSIYGRVLWFACGASLTTALLFGLGPAMDASGVDLRGVLQDEGRAVGVSRRGRRMRGLLVAAQITASLGLISAAWSIVSSARSFYAVSPGFDRDRLIVLRLTLAGNAYDSSASRTAFVDRAIRAPDRTCRYRGSHGNQRLAACRIATCRFRTSSSRVPRRTPPVCLAASGACSETILGLPASRYGSGVRSPTRNREIRARRSCSSTTRWPGATGRA